MKLTAHADGTFYGINEVSIRVEGLQTALQKRMLKGQVITTLTFSDEKGVKWEIKPTAFSKKSIPSFFRLYHRNSWGRRGFHSQGQGEYGGTSAGVRTLIEYVRKHEIYERGGEQGGLAGLKN